MTIFSFSDEALESLGDKISSPVETTEIMGIKRYEAQQTIQDSKRERRKDKNEDEHQNMNTCYK